MIHYPIVPYRQICGRLNHPAPMDQILKKGDLHLSLANLRRCRIELKIIGAAKAGPVAQLNDLLCAQLPEFHRAPLPAVCLFHPMQRHSA